MTDATFRTQNVTPKNVEFKQPDEDRVSSISTEAEVPYLDYEANSSMPYTADYYDLGEYWNVYNKELGIIEGYFQNKVKTGELANHTDTIKNEIKNMEKMLNLKDEPRKAVKIGVLTEHIKFLMGVKAVKENSTKYGSSK